MWDGIIYYFRKIIYYLKVSIKVSNFICAFLSHGFSEQNNLFLSHTNYGYEFISAFVKENMYAVQLHPEKSHDQGLQLINNFCKI